MTFCVPSFFKNKKVRSQGYALKNETPLATTQSFDESKGCQIKGAFLPK
jgi:hypothetical protein